MNSNYLKLSELKDINGCTPREQTIFYVTFIRLSLYNSGKSCVPKAIVEEMQRLEISRIPSIATTGRILKQHCLTHGRTGYYPGDFV